MAEHARTAFSAAGVTITHPDRVMIKAGNVTKGELATYHAAIAPHMLARISRHPLSLLRCPAGAGSKCFYQRKPGAGLGPDVHPFEFRHKGKVFEYLYIDDEKGLLDLIQMGVVEVHPWGAAVDNIDYPDRLIFDLDPAPGIPLDTLKTAAQELRARLEEQGLQSRPKCTGGKGLHVVAPLDAKDKWAAVRSFAAAVAQEMAAASPRAYVATMSKAKREGKIFIDYFRNDYTATAIADYSVRARPDAPVAVPLEWDELDDLKSPSQFRMAEVVERLKRRKPDSGSPRQTLPRK